MQAQWKMALTDGIKNDFMFYSLGIGQQTKPKKTKPIPVIPVADTAKTVVKKDTVATEPKVETDTDGDGILDKDDKCPEAPGTAENNGCPMKILDGGKLIRSSGDSMTYFIRFDFDKANITREALQ